jgi:O-succinylbenzoic acid--CoA ligase
MGPNDVIKKEFWQDSASWRLEAGRAELMPERHAPSVIFATSGSTGQPRYFALSKHSLIISAQAVNQHLGVDPSSVWGLCLPWWHVGGFGVLARAYQAGCQLAMYEEKWQALAALEWLREKRVTHVSLVPTQLHDFVQASCAAPRSLRAIVIGGGKLSDELAQQARALGWPILASYGMTEAGSQIATQRMASDSTGLSILPCWRVRSNVDGNIEIAGDALFHGEWRKEKDGWCYQSRIGDWYTTQDIGAVVGTELQIFHRNDALVKVLGELVNPHAIEESLMRAGMPMGRVVVLALPDARRQHVLCLVHEDVEQSLVEKAVHDYHMSCPAYAKLQSILHVPCFPRSDLGKILRQPLMAIARAGSDAHKSSLAPEG